MIATAGGSVSEPAVRLAQLWVGALDALDPHRDDPAWYPDVLQLAQQLREEVSGDESLFDALVANAVVLQQFLLEVASRPGGRYERSAIVSQAGRLLVPEAPADDPVDGRPGLDLDQRRSQTASSTLRTLLEASPDATSTSALSGSE